jgi:hypothetical protein
VAVVGWGLPIRDSLLFNDFELVESRQHAREETWEGAGRGSACGGVAQSSGVTKHVRNRSTTHTIRQVNVASEQCAATQADFCWGEEVGEGVGVKNQIKLNEEFLSNYLWGTPDPGRSAVLQTERRPGRTPSAGTS